MPIKKVIPFFVLIIAGLIAVFTILWFGMKNEKKNIINVEGFEIEYSVTDRELTTGDFDNIEMGSSIFEISDILGEPDTWIGSGMLRPVYFLKDNKVVVLYFEYPAACDGLREIVLIDENGKSRIIKQKMPDEIEEEYIQFEELFRNHEADMKDFIELSQESILGEKEYYMLFDEDWYSSVLSGNLLRECILILYDNNTFVIEGNEEIKEELNKNVELMKTLDTIKEKEVITSISLYNSYYVDCSFQMIEFTVDPKYTPFITSNNGVSNYFIYCNDDGCEKYGYKNIEGNWYMRISPAPE